MVELSSTNKATCVFGLLKTKTISIDQGSNNQMYLFTLRNEDCTLSRGSITTGGNLN